MADAPVVVALPERVLLTDTVGQLRRLADRLDAGQFGEVVRVAVVVEQPGCLPPLILGFGQAEDAVQTLGLLSLGCQRLGSLLLTGCVRREV